MTFRSPALKLESGKLVQLIDCTREQCEDLIEQLYDQMHMWQSMGNDGMANQISEYVTMVYDRIDAIDEGEVKQAPPQKQPLFKDLRKAPSVDPLKRR